jgi:hypothetical protein
MGLTYASITIQNSEDVADYRRNRIGEDEIREVTVNAMVDTGSVQMAINEEIQQALGLEIYDYRPSILANSLRVSLPIVGPIIIKLFDRYSMTSAIVRPGDSEPLLGAIPLEEMDLYVHPARNVILPIHPEGQLMSLK